MVGEIFRIECTGVLVVAVDEVDLYSSWKRSDDFNPQFSPFAELNSFELYDDDKCQDI